MEAIKEFEVELDISDRHRLYDYGNEENIYREEKGEWDYAALRARGAMLTSGETNENRLVRIRKMDGAIANFRCMEKDVKKEKEKEGKKKGVDDKQESKGDYFLFSSFDSMRETEKLPQRVLPVYNPGETVHGKVILDLSDKLDAQSFSISFKGKAEVRIRIYHQRGYYDDIGKERYVNEETIVWQKADGKDELADNFALLSVGSLSQSKWIPPGRHEFKFSFHIPQDARQSTPSLLDSYCDYGLIAYRIKATLEKGNAFGRGNIAACRGIWVEKPFDIAEVPSEIRQGITVEEAVETGFFGRSGPVRMTVTLPRKAFARGESISVRLIMDNQSDTPIKSLSSYVRLGGKCRTGLSKISPARSVDIKTSKNKVGPVQSKDYQMFEFSLPLDFSEAIVDSHLVPVGSLEECTLIDVKYELIVVAKRKALHRNLELKVPLTICTSNSLASQSE